MVKVEEIYLSDNQTVNRIREEWTEPEGRTTGEAENVTAQPEVLPDCYSITCTWRESYAYRYSNSHSNSCAQRERNTFLKMHRGQKEACGYRQIRGLLF